MSITSGPYYEVPALALANWVESKGADRWWAIDGDTRLTSRVVSPCPAVELGRALREVDRPLLVTARTSDAHGQVIGPDEIEQIADRLGSNIYQIDPSRPKPGWADDRCLWLCWKDIGGEWMLAEDSQATEAFRDVRLSPLGAAHDAH